MCCHVLLNDNECQILLPSKSPEVWSMFHLSNTSMSAISLYWHAVAIRQSCGYPMHLSFSRGGDGTKMRKTSARHLAAQQRTSAAGWRIKASAPIARAQSSRPLPGIWKVLRKAGRWVGSNGMGWANCKITIWSHLIYHSWSTVLQHSVLYAGSFLRLNSERDYLGRPHLQWPEEIRPTFLGHHGN